MQSNKKTVMAGNDYGTLRYGLLYSNQEALTAETAPIGGKCTTGAIALRQEKLIHIK